MTFIKSSKLPYFTISDLYFLFPNKVSDKDADYFKATRTCGEDKGHLISLEDTEEIERLYKKENGTKDVTFFTSALYFSFENEWRWMSESSKILQKEIFCR